MAWMAAAVAVLVAAIFALRAPQRGGAMPRGLIAVNGRLEGDSVSVAVEFGGRIQRLSAREGDTVSAGQVLVELDDDTLRTREAQASAALIVAQRRAGAARVSLEVERRQVTLEVESARSALAAAEARLGKARVAEEQSAREHQRAQMLLREGILELQRAEQLALAHRVAQAESATAGAELERAARALDQAKLGGEHVRAREAELHVLDAAVEQAAAQLAEVRVALDDLIVRSPIAGTVTRRYVNIGEVVAPGAALYELVDLDALYLRAYVPEPLMGLIPLGAPARIYTDALPDDPAPAELRFIASRAEFTPKEVQTPDERVKLVYAVKLYLLGNPEHRLMPGLSADAVIRFREDVPWTPPRW